MRPVWGRKASADYCTRLEQGRSPSASTEVLDALATALRLDDAERAHLHTLACPASTQRKRRSRPQRVHPATRDLLDTWRPPADRPSSSAVTPMTPPSALSSVTCPYTGQEFRRYWSDHKVHQRTTGTKDYHPLVGDLTITYQALTPGDGPEQTLFIYRTEPDVHRKHHCRCIVFRFRRSVG